MLDAEQLNPFAPPRTDISWDTEIERTPDWRKDAEELAISFAETFSSRGWTKEKYLNAIEPRNANKPEYQQMLQKRSEYLDVLARRRNNEQGEGEEGISVLIFDTLVEHHLPSKNQFN